MQKTLDHGSAGLSRERGWQDFFPLEIQTGQLHLARHGPLRIAWLPETKPDANLGDIQNRREIHGGQTVLRSRWNPLPARLWEQLVLQAGIAPEIKWARLAKPEAQRLVSLLTSTELPVTAKSMNKEEFVTCGGIPLPEVDFKTMESRIVEGLHFAGEALDIDGITGGFNFQAAWTTAWTAGQNLP